jgi:hypothetical protein
VTVFSTAACETPADRVSCDDTDADLATSGRRVEWAELNPMPCRGWARSRRIIAVCRHLQDSKPLYTAGTGGQIHHRHSARSCL